MCTCGVCMPPCLASCGMGLGIGKLPLSQRALYRAAALRPVPPASGSNRACSFSPMPLYPYCVSVRCSLFRRCKRALTRSLIACCVQKARWTGCAAVPPPLWCPPSLPGSSRLSIARVKPTEDAPCHFVVVVCSSGRNQEKVLENKQSRNHNPLLFPRLRNLKTRQGFLKTRRLSKARCHPPESCFQGARPCFQGRKSCF